MDYKNLIGRHLTSALIIAWVIILVFRMARFFMKVTVLDSLYVWLGLSNKVSIQDLLNGNFYNELNDKYTNNSIKTIKGKIISYKSINKKILLSIVINEIFYAFIISKELKKLRIAFSISEKVEKLNRIIEECKK